MYEQRTHLYLKSIRLITELEATGVQLTPETYIELSLALNTVVHLIPTNNDLIGW